MCVLVNKEYLLTKLSASVMSHRYNKIQPGGQPLRVRTCSLGKGGQYQHINFEDFVNEETKEHIT